MKRILLSMFDFLSNKFSTIFSKITGKGTLTESDIADVLAKVKDALIEADVPLALVETFCADIKNEVVGQKVITSLKPTEHFIKVVHERLKSFLGGQDSVPFTFQLPSVVMVMGLQGSGKTTSIAKMAYLVHQEAQAKGKARRILLASVDFYRPAAVDQLEILAKQIPGIVFYRAQSSDPIIAAKEIYAYYQKGLFELLFLDTAGRLHVDTPLLEQLQAIDKQLKPKYKILVLDAMTGQESLSVAQSFNQAVGFDMAVLTKLDSNTRAGAAFAFRYALKKPIVFIGSGEKIADLERLYPERLAGRILGMGDIATLVEQATQKIQQSEHDALEKSFKTGQLSLQDFADQMKMVQKLGSLSQLVKYMPGAGSASVSPDMVQKGEVELKRFEAIISSMTKKERLNHRILDGSRKKRIALGAGVAVTDVNLLLERFEQSQQYVKLLKKFGRFPGLFK
jgi:signal recognition particle subunit SRP54